MASSTLVLSPTSDDMSTSSLVSSSSDLLIVDEMTPSDHHTSPNDLESLAYSIAMLIVEGRDSTKTLQHATPSIDKLVGNMFNLSQQQSESVVKKNSKTISSSHICDESTNQCRLASKIKKNIEKCVGHHHHHHGRLDQVDVVLEDVSISSPTSSQLKRRLSNKLKHQHHHDQSSVYVLRKQRVDSNNNLRIVESSDHTTSSILIDNDICESQDTYCYSQSCVTIQVFLVPECCHHQIRLEHGDNLIDQDQHNFSGELLERWTITMISEKNNESTVNISKALLSINGLFQAIRSYLHFSQISSWINQSKGSEPKHLAFSVSYTSEKNSNIESRQIIETGSSDQQQSFEFHSFPTLSLVLLNNRFWISTSSTTTSNTSVRVNNSINLLRSNLVRVGLYSRKRNSFSETITNSIGIPLIPCSLGHQSSSDDSQVETGEIDNTISSSSSSSLKPLISSPPPLQQQFYLPHWSTIMMTPGSPVTASNSLFRRSSVESSANENDLAVDLLDEQEKFQKSSSTTLTLITTPTSFNSSPSFLFKDDSSREEKSESSSSSSSSVKNFLISQSPKVLVSNHQLDLCTHATNNLKLDEPMSDELACAASKRKLKASFNQTNGSVTHSKKFFTGEEEDGDQVHEAMDIVSREEQSGDDDLIRKLNNNPSVNFKKIGEDDLIKSRLLPRRNYPLSSSPAPLRKCGSAFDFDTSLRNPKSIKNAFCLSKAIDNNNNSVETQSVVNEENNKMSSKQQTVQLSYSNANFNSIQLTPNRLLGSFEESLLNGRMNPVGVVDGFYAEIGASGSFFPEHVTLPVHTAFYQVCEDVAASPYLGVLNLASLGKRGYKVPSKGTIQVTLFNPNNTVVKMFVVMYDLSDMPPGNKTFLRQRTMYVPLLSSSSSSTTTNTTTSGKISQRGGGGGDGAAEELLKSYLRYLIHLRFATSRSGKMYLHTNIKLIFARNKCEIDPRLAKYEYKTFTEAPRNPKYSPKK